MNILYITQYFYPEVGATTNRALANIRYLSQKGHKVTVLTEMPNHPQGIIRPDYRGKIYLSEKMGDYLVKRLWVFTSPRKTFYSRILFYLSFALLSSIYTLLTIRKFDVVYLTSPPLFVAIPGLLAKMLSPQNKIFFEVRDLWPDSAIDMGELHNKSFIKLSYSLENKIYQKATLIITVTEYIKNAIHRKGIPENKIKVVYNGIEPETATKTLDRKIDLLEEKTQEKYFIVIYAGILGLAQNLVTLLNTADLLRDEKIFFLIAGSGPKEQELHQLASEMELSNLVFTGEIPREDIHNYLLSADCGVVPLQRVPVFKGALTSKLFEYMALGLPVLLGIEGEAAEILSKAEAGLTFIPENSEDLKEKILYLRDHPEKLKNMKGRGKDFVLKNFNRRLQAEQLSEIIEG